MDFGEGKKFGKKFLKKVSFGTRIGIFSAVKSKFEERGGNFSFMHAFSQKKATNNGIPPYILLIVMFLTMPITLSCPKKDSVPESSLSIVEQTRTAWKSEGPCPEDMVWVKPADICMDKYEFPNMKGELPLGGVTYEEAERLCKAYGKRLPTSQEWLLACGGKEELIYPYGNEYREGVCRVDLKYAEGPAPSGTLTDCKSPFGVFDMSGNLWEWTSSEGFEKGTKYVHGGSWRSFPGVTVCAFRGWEPPEGGGDDYGFRCVKDLNKRTLFR